MKKAKSIPDPGPLRLLIVEDSPADAELIQRELRRAGISFTSRLVKGKKEFNQSLADFQPQVILSDFKMPGFDGLAALEIARTKAPDTPFIFVSGSIGEEKAIEMLAQGASDYIFKDNLARLGPAVKRVIEAARLKLEKKKSDEELQRHIDELRLMAEAADRFIDINDLDKIYAYLAQAIREISGADYLMLTQYDEKLQVLQPKITSGFEPFLETIRQHIQTDLMQMVFYLKDMQPDEFSDFVSRRIMPLRDGLYGYFNRKISRSICRVIENSLAIKSMYVMGFSWENQLFGSLTISFKKGNELKNSAQIEALANQAAISIKRLLAEQALRESEGKYRTLVTQSPDGIFIIDLQGNFLSVNQAMCAGLKYSETEFLSLTIWDIVPMQYMDLHKKRLADILKGKAKNEVAEYMVKGKDDETHYIAILSAPYYKDDVLVGFQGIARDITEKKKMEIRLRESEEYYRTLVETSPDAIVIVDGGGRINFASQKAFEFFGIPAQTPITGIPMMNYVEPEEITRVQERLAEILSGHSPPKINEYRLRRHDHNPFWAEVSSASLRDSAGKSIGLLLVCRDISERKRAEEELQFRNVILSTQQEASIDGILVVDVDNRIVSYNHRFVEMWDIPPELVEKKNDEPVLKFVTKQTADPGSFLQRVQYLYEHKQETSRDEIVLKNGRIFDRYSAPMVGPDDQYYGRVWNFRDISERKHHEEALRESEEKYRLIAENTAETITVLDLNLKFTYVSPSIFKLRGYTVEESLNQTLQQSLTPDSFATIQKVFSEEMALEASGNVNPKRSHSLELQEYRKDGSIVWVENSLSFLRNTQGKAIGFLAVSKDITERKRAEAEQKKLLDIIEKSLNEIYLFDSTTLKFEYVNQGALQNIGYTLDEMRKLTPADIKPEYTEAKFRELVQPLITGEKDKLIFTTIHKRKNGTDYPVEVHLQLFKQINTSVFFAVINNISERKRAGEQIQYQASLLQNVSDAIIATDQNNNIQVWNKAAEKIYGWKTEEVIGKKFRDAINPEYRYQSREEVMTKLGQEGVWSGEIIHHLRDGKRIPVQSTITILKDTAGVRSGLVSVNHDISERKRAEEQLKERDLLLKNLTAQVPGMVYTFMRKPDGTYCIPYSSDAIQGIFGVSARDVIQDASAIFKPILAEDRPKVVTSIEDSARTLTPWQAEYRVQLPGQPVRWMLGQSDPIRLADGSILWYGFNTDITERKQAEELIRASLKEKEVLLQEIHHRVKNNLQIISGLLTLQADQAAGKSLDEIFRESQDRIRSIALIHEKLYRSHNLAEIAFDEYLRSLTESLFTTYAVASSRIIATYEMEPILFTIEKAIPLGLIVNELISNALKHAFPDGRQGKIHIALHGYAGAKSFTQQTDSGTLYRVPVCELIVADDGIGLPSGQVPEQQKSLGMNLVSMLAKQLQAELKVKTAPGTEFHLLFSGLPVSDKSHGA